MGSPRSQANPVIGGSVPTMAANGGKQGRTVSNTRNTHQDPIDRIFYVITICLLLYSWHTAPLTASVYVYMYYKRTENERTFYHRRSQSTETIQMNNLKLSICICYEFRFTFYEFSYLSYVNIFRYHFTNKWIIFVTDVAMIGRWWHELSYFEAGLVCFLEWE